MFKQKVAWGAIYPCICCEGTYFRNGVKKADIEKMKTKNMFAEAVDVRVDSKPQFYVKNSYWICKGCSDSITRGVLPKRSAQNALKIFKCHLPKLTEVENVLLAPRINFIKMIKLPVSRMSGIRDRIVNVPIKTSTIKQTVKSLPRTLDEAQVSFLYKRTEFMFFFRLSPFP